MCAEWDKMIVGDYGDWFLYGHATAEDPSAPSAAIRPRYLVDLAVARDWMHENHGPLRGPNKDVPGRRCWLYAFNVREMVAALGPRCLIASYPPAEQLRPQQRAMEYETR